MKSRILALLGVIALPGCRNEGSSPSPSWEPVPAGMVMTRNFLVPENPQQQGYHQLPRDYRLGSKAYARALPAWWTKLAASAGLDKKWSQDLPLVYAGEVPWQQAGRVLLVVQAARQFTGDGFLSPGPELYLVARLLKRDGDRWQLLKEHTHNLGDMQYSCLFAGVPNANGKQIVFRTQAGREFDSQKVEFQTNHVLTLGADATITVEKVPVESPGG